jgi:hypothetical protein
MKPANMSVRRDSAIVRFYQSAPDSLSSPVLVTWDAPGHRWQHGRLDGTSRPT